MLRGSSTYRQLVGGVLAAIAWGLYFVRVIWGVGPMRDTSNNQSPATHYLFAALAVTAMTTIWIVGMSRRRRDP